MVKKAKWLENVKKAFSPDVKKLKHQAEEEETEISYPVLITRSRSSPPQFEVRVDEVNYEHKKKIKHLSHPPSEAEEDDALEEDSTPSSPEFVPPPATPDKSPVKSKEDAAAVSIQSTFRGHLARKEAKRMKRLARLKLFMEGSVVQRQAGHTIKSMQAYTCVQSQIYSRRIRMSNENKARHKQLLQKHAKDIAGSKNGGGNRKLSNQSKKKVEAGLLNSEATMRRDKALASASTHLQHLKPTNTTMFIDPNNLTWGWSWSERWTAEQPGENSEKEQTSTVKPSVKTSTNTNSHGGETAKSSIRKNLPNNPSTSSSSTTRKNKPTPPSIRPKTTDAIAKNSEKNLRHSIARSSVSDDEGLASSAARLRNMVPTKLADEIAKSSEKNRRHNIARSSFSDDEGLLASSAARHRNMVPTKPSDKIAKNSEKNLRHNSIAARSSISDDEGLSSSLARRRNMVPTKPPRGGKIKAQSSSSVASAAATTEEEGNGVLQEKAPAKKRASPAPKPRRSPGPAKVENNVLKAVKTSV
ncbi:unnamed protein product [Eruca vesicaria subsp. sativa]|uniref:Uncharacterized protein n=1 Tax=Eruca vesicaria subsp. sativa TaxID=29727 RepID=A0ABC8KF06_ERUVS|nr:unnamed protein product [Eruca vesicaria subsp. sativa]